uniref:Transposase (Putative), gypsy type n=1 Tax=Tanacetum cinerariifolium TaxID=118510 RepID=A0A6L2MRQ8_TANCI|nr:transposase (putative), gypsy type [Tanacetum cinerariifolium]
MSFSKRPDSDAVCYTKPLDSLKRWNDHFYWVDSFACPASFPWHTDKNVSRDPFPKSTEFSADDNDVLVSHPTSFWKFPKPFLCLIGMSRNYTLDEDTYPTFLRDDGTEIDLFSFIQVADPTKVKVGEQEHPEEETRLLDSTVGRVVQLLPVAPAHAKSELEASVMNASGSSHPPKKLRADCETSGEVATSDKSLSVLKELLASNMLNVEAGVAAIATLPLVTSLVSPTPEHESGAPVDSNTGLNLRTIGASERFVISLDSCHHSGTNASRAEDDSIIRSAIVPPVMTEVVVTSHAVTVPLVLKTGIKALGSWMLRPCTKCFFLQWNVLNESLLDDYDVSREFVDHLDPPAMFSQIREMDYHHLFTEFNVGTARQACLNAKARDEEIDNLKAQLLLKETEAAERNVSIENEKESLDGKVTELQSLVFTKDLELKDLNDVVHALETTCFGLREQVSGYEWLKEQIEEFWDVQMNIINDKVAKLDVDLLEMALHLEEKFYPHLLTTIFGRSAIEKGMQDGLSAGIDHGKTGRSLADVVAYNLAAEADYNSALQRLREVDFSLLAELKSHKDTSVEDIMNLLRLEGPLADAPGMNDLQPNVDQLMLLVYWFEDQVVLGETSLSFALSVTHSRVERIRENVAAKRSALIDVWTLLVNPLSVENLVGEAGTSESVLAIISIITALSTTFASTSSVPPITIKDYEIVGTDGPKDA